MKVNIAELNIMDARRPKLKKVLKGIICIASKGFTKHYTKYEQTKSKLNSHPKLR